MSGDKSTGLDGAVGSADFLPGCADRAVGPAPATSAADQPLPGPIIQETLKRYAPTVRRVAIARALGVGLSFDDGEDLASRVILHLLEKSLPAYRAKRGNIKAYLAVCLRHAISNGLRQMLTQRMREDLAISEGLDGNFDKLHSRYDYAIALQVERLLTDLSQRPEHYLPPVEARLLWALLNIVEQDRAALAARMGMTPGALTTALWRLRARLALIAQEQIG